MNPEVHSATWYRSLLKLGLPVTTDFVSGCGGKDYRALACLTYYLSESDHQKANHPSSVTIAFLSGMLGTPHGTAWAAISAGSEFQTC